MLSKYKVPLYIIIFNNNLLLFNEMVSLSRGTNSLIEEGTFFDNSQSTQPDVQCLLQPIIGEGKSKKFTPLNTHIPAALLLTLAVIMEVAVLALKFSPQNTPEKCEPYFVSLYAHVVYWAFSFVLDFHFKKKHHESRLNGYLEFFQQTHHHSRIPFYITSIFNTILLLISTLFHDQYQDLESKCESNGFLSPMNYMCFIITLENVFMVPTIIAYIYKVLNFNKNKLCPDVLRDDWMASFVQDSYSAGEVGYREPDNHVEELLEKQADMLRYLKEQNSRLVQKVLILNNLLKAQTESLQC